MLTNYPDVISATLKTEVSASLKTDFSATLKAEQFSVAPPVHGSPFQTIDRTEHQQPPDRKLPRTTEQQQPDRQLELEVDRSVGICVGMNKCYSNRRADLRIPILYSQLYSPVIASLVACR